MGVQISQAGRPGRQSTTMAWLDAMIRRLHGASRCITEVYSTDRDAVPRF